MCDLCEPSSLGWPARDCLKNRASRRPPVRPDKLDRKKGDPKALGFDGSEVDLAVIGPALLKGSITGRFGAGRCEFGADCAGGLRARMIRRQIRHAMVKLNILKDGDHRVVVADGDGIEFVIVAASAADSHPQHGRAHGLHHLIEAVESSLNLC